MIWIVLILWAIYLIARIGWIRFVNKIYWNVLQQVLDSSRFCNYRTRALIYKRSCFSVSRFFWYFWDWNLANFSGNFRVMNIISKLYEGIIVSPLRKNSGRSNF
jgi:hypothetical protein